ncbi:hypothetical protein, partial [Actinomyces ruminis]|uniref:hypothetical protein n=1 Tax=Actinomyces ruminis TaxID=1937003 RepID=UPI001C556BBD
MSENGTNGRSGGEVRLRVVEIVRFSATELRTLTLFVPISDVENVSVCSVLGVCDPISDWRPGWVCPGIDLSA